MRRIFITGSSDGLGFLAGKLLVDQGHRVVLHARNETRARELHARLPGGAAVVVGDVSTVAAMKSVARAVVLLLPYSALSASIGSTLSARRVGTTHASRHTANMNAT